jgi:methenyltetrahydromethanopterin cyclohydrolase
LGKSPKTHSNPELYQVTRHKILRGATIIDAGVKNPRWIFSRQNPNRTLHVECAAQAQIGFKSYGDITFPSITITSDQPAIAMLGSQFAGWRIKEDENIAIGSGPARAIALKPKDVYAELGYKDESDKAVLTTGKATSYQPTMLIEKVTKACNVKPENLILVVAPTASIAGLTQVTGRIVEVGIHKLRTVGLDPKVIRYACGYAPMPPVGTDFEVAMARTNDVILYGGTVYLTVDYDDEAKLQEIIQKAPSETSKDYGKPFLQIFREADKDFYKIDHGLFAPARIMINNAKTGRTFKAGKINPDVLVQSLGF